MEKVKERKILKIVAVFTVLFALTLIITGVYFSTLATGKNITGTAIDKLNYLVRNYIDSGRESLLKDNFTVESDIDINIESEYYKNLSKTQPEYLETVKLFKNLSDLEVKSVIKQNVKDKKLFLNLESKIKEEKLVNFKYLVDNSTEYYFIEGILNNYVNNGSCNYFESLAAENNTKENIEYLYSFVLESLKNNLKEEYFQKSTIETNISGENEQVNLVSIRIDDKRYKEILKGILNDLKSDEKANKILTSMNENFSKVKIKDSHTYIAKGASYTFNIYTTRVLNKFLKLDLVYLSGDGKQNITYEGNDSRGTLYFIDNGKVNSVIDCTFNKDKYVFKIKDSGEKEQGVLKVEFDSNSKNISLIADDDNIKINLEYVSKYTDINGNKSYTNEQKLSFKIIESNINKYNGDITVISKVASESKIDEDITNAILKSTVSEEKKAEISNKVLTVLERLAR